MARCGQNDLLVVYYSGHAIIRSERLELCLSDYPSLHSRISIDRLIDMHRVFDKPRMLLILDCCHSGAAGPLIAKEASMWFPTKVFLLAATSAHEDAHVDANGSPFANGLRESLGHISNQNHAVTAVSLIAHLKRLASSSISPHLHISDGLHDLLISAPVVAPEDFDRLEKTTYRRIQRGRIPEREALWFALGDEPERLLLGVSHRFFDEGNIEPSWLVRRAIGSALGSVTFLQHAARKHVATLLQSPVWLNVAAGLNASKRLFPKDFVIETCQRLLRSGHPMDVKWLAALYLHDLEPDLRIEPSIAMEAGFLNTEWGIAEAVYRLNLVTVEDLQAKAAIKQDHDQLDAALVTHSVRVGELARLLAGESDWNNVFLSLAKQNRGLPMSVLRAAWTLSRIQRRGATGASGSKKWLRSKLYGSWRGAIAVDVEQDVLGTLSPAERVSFLTAVPHLVFDVSCKMAVLEGLTALSPADIGAVRWAAEDPHPWIRRCYLEFICRLPPSAWQETIYSLDWNSILAVDRHSYPGHLDLVIQAGNAVRLCEPDSKPMRALSESIANLPTNERGAIRRLLEIEGVNRPAFRGGPLG